MLTTVTMRVADLVVGLEPAAGAVEVGAPSSTRWMPRLAAARDRDAARPFAVAGSCRMSHSSPSRSCEVFGGGAHLLHREDVDVAAVEPVAHALAVRGADPVGVDGGDTEGRRGHAFDPMGAPPTSLRGCVRTRAGVPSCAAASSASALARGGDGARLARHPVRPRRGRACAPAARRARPSTRASCSRRRALGLELRRRHRAQRLVAIGRLDVDPGRGDEGDDAREAEPQQQADEDGEGREQRVAASPCRRGCRRGPAATESAPAPMSEPPHRRRHCTAAPERKRNRAASTNVSITKTRRSARPARGVTTSRSPLEAQ